MKHRTKKRLILLYTVLTVVSVVLCMSELWNVVPFGFAWPEILTLVFMGGDADLTSSGVIVRCTLFVVMLLHVAAPLCGAYRIYAPFKALLCVKAVLSAAASMLLPGAYSGVLFVVHGALFVLTAIFFRREDAETASVGKNCASSP